MLQPPDMPSDVPACQALIQTQAAAIETLTATIETLTRTSEEQGLEMEKLRKLLSHFGEVLELCVAMFVGTCGFVLERLAARQAQFLEQHSPQGVHSNLEALVLQLFGQFGDRAIGPADVFIHRRTSRVLLNQLLHSRPEFGLRDAS